MIMNNMGGGGSSGGGIKYRTVGLTEIVFNSSSDSVLPGYRVINGTSSSYYAKFYFPGKLVKVLSFKYRQRYWGSGQSYGDVISYTGAWHISGNVGSPEINFNWYSSKTDMVYAITEITAIVEDEANGGTTTSVTFTAAEIASGTRKLLSNNIISLSNLVTSAAVPSGKDSTIGWLSEFKISGRFIYIKGQNPSQPFTFTVHLAETDTQGVLVCEDQISGGSSMSGFSFFTGFKPKYVFAAMIADPSSNSSSVDGFIGGQWSDAYLKTVTYNNGYRCDISSVGSHGYTTYFTTAYDESTGRATVDFNITYGTYVDYPLHVIAIG